MMDERSPIGDLAERETAENVVIFVSDSTRYDAVPDRVTNLGPSGKAIAPSTFTAPSFPSLFTGVYPAEHGIWDFNERLGVRPRLFEGPESVGFRADTIWTHLKPEEKPPRRMLGVEATESLTELEPPFVYIEHHKGGHLPYGYTFEECESTEEFFDTRLESLDRIPSLYQRSVDTACDRFLDVVAELERRGLMDETLVIFTSDHGEVLGEVRYGRPYGHEQPLVPELAEVPLVFAGAGLPDDVELPGVYSGTDIVPTALSALGRSGRPRVSGIDLWRTVSGQDRLVRSDVLRTKELGRLGRTFTKYEATSVWDGGGGTVYHRGPRLERLGYALYIQLYAKHEAPWLRSEMGLRGLRGLFGTYWPKRLTFGTPSFERQDAERVLPAGFEREPSAATEDRIPADQLEKLGYLE